MDKRRTQLWRFLSHQDTPQSYFTDCWAMTTLGDASGGPGAAMVGWLPTTLIQQLLISTVVKNVYPKVMWLNLPRWHWVLGHAWWQINEFQISSFKSILRHPQIHNESLLLYKHIQVWIYTFVCYRVWSSVNTHPYISINIIYCKIKLYYVESVCICIL